MPFDPSPTRRATWPLQLATLAVVWGASFLFIKVALDELEPLQISALRIIIGALTLLALLVARRERLPSGGRIWRHLFVIGIFANALPFSLFAWGETRLTSVQAGIWNATTPLMVLLVLLALPGERPDRRRISGLLLGFAGVIVLLAPWRGVGTAELSGHLAFALAAASYGVSTPYMRWAYANRRESTVSLSAAQLLCAASVMLVVASLTVGAPSGPFEPSTIGSVLALGVLGTGLAYVLFTNVLQAAGAAVASSVTFLMPIVSTILGVWLLNEAAGWNELVGAAIVLTGVWLTATRSPAQRGAA